MAVIDFDIATSSTKKGVLRQSASDFLPPEDVLRIYLSAITGIDKTLVRKRWLIKPGTQPKIGVNWAAIGVDSVETQGLPYQDGQKSTIEVQDTITRTSWQTLRCTATFYGTDAAEIADNFREGIQLYQNDAQLRRYGLTIQGVDNDVRHLPDLLFEQWIDRYDVTFKVGRSVTRIYGVRTIASADVEIYTEKGKL